MRNLIRVEWMKLCHNRTLGVIVLVLVIIAFGLVSTAYGPIPEQITAETPQYFTGVEMSRGELVFQHVMGDSSYSGWMAVFFAAIFIGAEFENRSINRAIFAGNTRGKIFAVKVIEFYVVGCLVFAIHPLVACGRYALPWMLGQVGEQGLYFLRCIGMRLLLDMGMMSLSLIVVFLFRDVIRSLGVTLLITILLSQIMGMRQNLPPDSLLYQILQAYPSSYYRAVANPVITGETLWIAAATSIIPIFVSVAVSYFLFRRAELA